MKDDFWVEESDGNLPLLMKRKRRVLKREIDFSGWGSRPLIDFLEVIGHDTVKKHSQREVTEFINKYVKDKGLLAPGKKNKKIQCDEMLHALFGKKIVSRTKLYDLLEEHFAENHDDSDDDLLYSSEEELYNDKVSKSFIAHKKGFDTPKNSFAAIITNNIKLVYLKRTLVQDLLKNYETFEHKVMGSFVKVKSDPNDIYQMNRFQLQQVTGVENLSVGGEAGVETHLRVSNYFKDVSIDMLSDDNFYEEEIDDLRNRTRAGLLKKLTVMELKSKAQTLHIDITKHWIAKEITLLQKLIDHANEKGRRRELFEFLERKKMLQNPSEVEKLLLTVPVVASEESLLDEIRTASSEKEGSNLPPDLALRGCSDVSGTNALGSGDPATTSRGIFNYSNATRVKRGSTVIGTRPIEVSSGYATAHDMFKQVEEMRVEDFVTPPQVAFSDSDDARRMNQNVVIGAMPFQVPNGLRNADEACKVEEMVSKSTEDEPRDNGERPIAPIDVIELSDDEAPLDAEDENGTCSESFEDDIWHYLDPQGDVQGPFSTCILKRWHDYNYFHPGFTVWKTGQSPNESVLLVDVLKRIFPAAD